MRGPDFEIPPLTAPPPAEPPAPTPAKPSPRRLGIVLAATVALVAAAAGTATWVATAEAPPTPSTTAATTVVTAPPPRPGSSTSVPATAVPRSSTRTCHEGEGDPGPFHSRPAGAGAPAVTLTFSPRLSAEALALITDALAAARSAFGETSPVSVRLHCDAEQFVADGHRDPDELRRELSQGLAGLFLGDIWIYGPNFDRHPVSERRRIVYHEYFHAVQQSLSRSRSTERGRVPVWLVEGSAKYFEYSVTPQELEGFRRTYVRRSADIPALGELEQPEGGFGTQGRRAAYAMGAVATDYLANKYGRELVQRDLWVALARTDWRSAFAEVFGVTVDDFYNEFEAYRQTLRP